MEFENVSFDYWARQLSIKVALLEDKMNALLKFLELEMEVKEKVITVTHKQREGEL